MLNLSEVTFMDGSGRGALVRARNPADRRSTHPALHRATRCVVPPLGVTGPHRRLAARHGMPRPLGELLRKTEGDIR
ncbi:hypothetical protein GCM10025734_03340 [Kitasatospora paranensis]